MANELAAGAVIAGFRIESLVGRGAMGEVYKARSGEQLVALKLLSDSLAHDERFRQRFLRESTLAASLHHPNVVPILGAGEEDGRLYLAMEYVAGDDLRLLLQRDGRLEPERAVALVGEVAGALDAAHAAGLVHRDVKPGNILIGEHVYVCDFGLARHVASVSSLTGDRGFVGTIDYVPPEQIEGGAIDARADVYSLGCVLYECLAGVRPFDRDSELAVVFAHLNEAPPALTDVRPELPAAFDAVFATALAKSPDDRYQSCGELAAAARAALRGEVRRRRRSRRRLIAAATTAALLGAAALAGIFLTRHGQSTSPVTISETGIEGARLGDSNFALQRIWGNGYQKLSMQTPPDYSVFNVRSRNLNAYFVGTTDKTVEIVTWNSNDRTAEGVGPCSTLAELKRAYGSRLRPSPPNTVNGVVSGWIVGKHLFFGTGPGPGGKLVEAVALYENPLNWASFNALSQGPCGRALETAPATRPKQLPAVAAPALPTRLSSRVFNPRVSVRAPSGWSRVDDTARTFTVASANGVSLGFVLDPSPVTARGRPVPNVSRTPRGLTTWLQHRSGLRLTAPQTILFGRPVLTATSVDVRHSARTGKGLVYLALGSGGRASLLRTNPGAPTRLYLAPIRIGTLVHTLAIVLRATSARSFTAAVPAVAAIVKNVSVRAAAAPNLSALSGFCTNVFQGSCRGELDPGTYSSLTFRPRLTFTVPVGWTNFTDHQGVYGLVPPGGDFSVVDAGKSDYLDVITRIASAKEGCADGHGSARTPEAIVRWLRHEPGIALTGPAPVTIGGLSGVVVDLRMRTDWKRTCPWSNGFPAQQVLTGLPPAPNELNHSLYPGRAVMRLYLLHYRHGTLGIEIDEVRGSSKLRTYSNVVKSFSFG